jgi:quinol monooxygenase YgiN
LRAAAQSPSENVYVVSHIDVTPDHAADTAKLLKEFAADSRKDTGVVRFEVMLQDGRTNHFTIVEVWRNRQAFEAHSALDHTKKYREQLHAYLGSPYDERTARAAAIGGAANSGCSRLYSRLSPRRNAAAASIGRPTNS